MLMSAAYVGANHTALAARGATFKFVQSRHCDSDEFAPACQLCRFVLEVVVVIQ